MNTVPLSKSQLRRRKRDQLKAQRSVWQKMFRALGLALMFLIILMAILVGIGRAYIDTNPQIKNDLTQKLAQRLGIGLQAEDIGVRWRWSGPQVTIDNLEFPDPQSKRSLLTFERAQIILDIKRYLKTGVLGVSAVEMQGSNLSLQRREGNVLFLNGTEVTELQNIFSAQSNYTASNKADASKQSVNYPKGIFKFDDINFIYQDLLTNKEIRVEDISTEINNNDQLLRLQVSAEADGLADKIKVTLSTPNPELHKKLSWQILLETDNLELAELSSQWLNLKPLLFTQQTPQMQAPSNNVKFSQGSSDIKVFMQYADSRVKTMNGTVDINNLELQRSAAVEKNSLSEMGFRFSYENDNDLLSFLVDRVKVEGAQENWPENTLIQFKRLSFSDAESESVEPIQRDIASNFIDDNQNQEKIAETPIDNLAIINRSPETLLVKDKEDDSLFKDIKLAEFKANYINLTELSPMLEAFSGFIPDRKEIQKVDWQEITGIVKNVSLGLDNPTNQEYSLDELSVDLEFENLSIPSINDSASLSGLTGALNYVDKKGSLNLDSKSLVYENLNVFRNKINLDSLISNVSITNDLDSWHFESENFEIKNPDFSVNSNIDILISKDSSPILNIEAQLKPKNLDRIKSYYPAKIMSKKVLTWLEDRVTGGTVDSAKVIFKGALEDYPFRNKKGEYLTEFTVKNLDVDYASGWPAVRLENADVQFKNESFSIDASQVKTGNLASFPLQAGFKDLSKSPLSLGVDTILDMQIIKEWINSSPLRDSVGEYLKYVDVTGQAQNNISISMPLGNIDELTVKGQIDFLGNELKLHAIDEKFTQLFGTLNYTKDVFYSENIKAVYQDEDIQATIQPKDQDTLINLHTEAQLGSFLGEHFSTYVTGNSTVDAEVRISKQEGVGLNNIKIRSNLLGSGLALPAPFAKANDTLMPLNLNIDILKFSGSAESQQMRLSGNMGDNLLRARFDSTVNNPDSDWSLRSLAIVGGEDENLFDTINPEQPRVSVLGDFSHVDFDEWLDFLNNDSNTQTNDALEIGTININLKKLEAIGQSFAETQVLIEPSFSEWNANIKNARLEGNIRFPRPWLDDSLIEANLDKYHLLLPEGDTKEISFDPREIPNVSVTVKDFQLANVSMGQTSLRIKKESNGARIENFKITNPTFDIDGSGGWFKTTNGETSLVSLQLSSTDLASTLKQLGYAPAASARSADALIELNWPGSPFVDILQEVSGSISFKLLNGDLREVEPGAGRFLALLSIAQLPKRLSLDFRDVFNSGLHYDELSADFTIHEGQAYTNNMLMRGPVADLGVVGRIGLATRDFEQAAVVQADLGSSLPIAGALAGGLGVGAALLIFSEIFKNPLKQATQVFYKIDGDWGNPKIVRTLPQNLKEIPVAPR